MKISVIVPVYNIAEYLPKCIDSILAQTYPDFELILVNDGSTDQSGAIAADYAHRHPDKISYISRDNGGISAARNTGLKVARGEYIAFVDSDDTVEPTMLETLLTLAEQHDADLAICALRSVSEAGAALGVTAEALTPGVVYTPTEHKELLLCENAAWNKLYRKRIIDDNTLAFTEGAWYEDLRFTKKYLLYTHRVVYTDAVLYNYLIRSGSIMNSRADKRNLQILDAFEEVIDYYTQRGVYEQYRTEIEFLAIKHIFIAASVRLIRADARALLAQLHHGFEALFPDYRRNPYIPTLDRNKKLIFHLIKHKMYAAVKLIFSIKG